MLLHRVGAAIKTRLNELIFYIICLYILIFKTIISMILILAPWLQRGGREAAEGEIAGDKIFLPFRMLFVYTERNMKKRAGYYEFL